MSEPQRTADYPRVPLTRFHNNTGEFLDLASKTPIVLTSHGRERHVIADSAYFRHLESIAGDRITRFMNLEAISAADMPGDDRTAFEASRPTPEELANDEWAG